MGALAGLSADTILDCVLFKLTTTRTRCEVYAIANGLSEKLSTGLLRPFISHIRAAEEQIDDGAHTIKLEPRKEYRDSKSTSGSNGSRDTHPCSWFTRGTVDRVIRFVTSPNLLERIIAIDLELAQLDEVIRVSLEEGYYVADKVYQRMEASISDCYEGGSISSSGHGPSSPASRAISPGRLQRKGSRGGSSPEVEMEETGELARQRRKALEFRRNLLRREQGLAFARATAAGFIQESMPALAAFAECFGAGRLREACAKFSALSRRNVNGARLPSCADSVVGQVGSHSVAGDEDTDFSDSRSDSGSSPPGIAVQTETDDLLQDSSPQSRQLSSGDAMLMAKNGHVHNMHSSVPSATQDFMTSGHESLHAVEDAHHSHGSPGQLNTAGYHRPVAGIPVNSVGSPVSPFMFQAGHPGSMLMQGGGHYAYAMGNSDGSLTMMQSPDHHSPNGSPFVILPYMGSPQSPTGRKLHRHSDVGGYGGQISPNQIRLSEGRSASVSPPKTSSKKSQLRWRTAGRKVSSMRRVVVIKKIHVMQQQSGKSLRSAEGNVMHETDVDDDGELDDEEEEKAINSSKYPGKVTNSQTNNAKANGLVENSAWPDGRMVNSHSLLHLVANGKVGKKKSIEMGSSVQVPLAGVKHEDTDDFPGALQDESAMSLVREHIPFSDKVSTAAVVASMGGKLGTASQDADFEEPDMFFAESKHVRSTSSDDHRTFLWEDELRGPLSNSDIPEQPDSHEEPHHGFPVVEPLLFPPSTSPKRQRVGLAMQEEEFRGPEGVVAVRLSGIEGNPGLDWEDPAGSSIRDDTLAGRAEVREDDFLGRWEDTLAGNLDRDVAGRAEIREDDFLGRWEDTLAGNLDRDVEAVNVEEQTPHKQSHEDVSEKSVKSRKGGPTMYGKNSRGTGPSKSRQLGTRNPESQIVAEAQQRAQDRLRIRQVEAAKRREDEKKKLEDARRQRLGRIASKVGALHTLSNDSSFSHTRTSRGPTPERVPRMSSPSSRFSPKPGISHTPASKTDSSTPVLSRPRPTTPRAPSPQLQSSKSGSATPVNLTSTSRNGRQISEPRSGMLHGKSLTSSAETLKSQRVVSSPSRRLLSPTAATLHREASVVDSQKKDVLATLRKRRASDSGVLLKVSSIPSKAVSEESPVKPSSSIVECGQEESSVSSNLAELEKTSKPDALLPPVSPEETENGLVEAVEASKEVTAKLFGSDEHCEGDESEKVAVLSEIVSKAQPADRNPKAIDVGSVAQTLASGHESDLEAKEDTPKRRGWAGDFSDKKGVEKVSRESISKVAPVISLPEDDMELKGVVEGGNSFTEQWKEWGSSKEFTSEDSHVGYLEEATSPGEVGAQSIRRKSEGSGQRKSGLRKLFGFGRRSTAHSSNEP